MRFSKVHLRNSFLVDNYPVLLDGRFGCSNDENMRFLASSHGNCTQQLAARVRFKYSHRHFSFTSSFVNLRFSLNAERSPHTATRTCHSPHAVTERMAHYLATRKAASLVEKSRSCHIWEKAQNGIFNVMLNKYLGT